MFGTLGGPELFLILLIALIVFGPRKLPEIGKSMGKMMAEFRKASNEFRQTIENEVEAEKIRDATRIEMPRLDVTEPSTAHVPSASEAGATSVHAESAASPVDAAARAGEASAPAGEAAVPAVDVPEHVAATVSRETTAAPVEPK